MNPRRVMGTSIRLPREAASKRRTILSLYEELQGKGYAGSYSSVRRYARKWQGNQAPLSTVYIPLSFGKGEAFRFDWSSEEVAIDGVVLRAGVAHFRLCYSRMSFIVAYPLQKMEMVLDAHVRAHDFFGGLCGRAARFGEQQPPVGHGTGIGSLLH